LPVEQRDIRQSAVHDQRHGLVGPGSQLCFLQLALLGVGEHGDADCSGHVLDHRVAGGNATYAAAANVVQSFTVSQGTQTITFNPLSNKAFGAAQFAISATASSGLTVSFASATNPVCRVSASTVTLVAVGTCTIAASQAGNGNVAAAAKVSQSFTVSQGTQAITFNPLSNVSLGVAPFAVGATASSGLTVSFASTTTAVCTLFGNTVTVVAVGTCTIVASQAGNANYAAAANVSQSFTASVQVTQIITFSALSNVVFGAVPFTIGATASSGLTVTFSSTTTGVCTVSGTTVTIVGAGSCFVTASQAGNTNYSSAPNVTQGLTVNQAAQTISFNSPGSVPYGAEPFTLSATSTSGLSVTLTSTTSGVCSVSGATVTIVGGGTCSLTASQAGNANYLAASSATQSFTVSQATQAITFIQRSGRDAAEQRHCDAGRDVDFGAGSQLCVQQHCGMRGFRQHGHFGCRGNLLDYGQPGGEFRSPIRAPQRPKLQRDQRLPAFRDTGSRYAEHQRRFRDGGNAAKCAGPVYLRRVIPRRRPILEMLSPA
jgi:hypothetical protein